MSIGALREPASVELSDGTAVLIRPIRPADARALQAFHARLSPESIYLRWLSAHPVLSDREAEELSNVDYALRMAFVATRTQAGGPEQIVGVARYELTGSGPGDEAEAAVVVEDAYQGRGLGGRLLQRLLEYARAQGIRTWVGEVNAENARMMKFVMRGGRAITKRLESGSWQIRVDISKLAERVADSGE